MNSSRKYFKRIILLTAIFNAVIISCSKEETEPKFPFPPQVVTFANNYDSTIIFNVKLEKRSNDNFGPIYEHEACVQENQYSLPKHRVYFNGFTCSSHLIFYDPIGPISHDGEGVDTIYLSPYQSISVTFNKLNTYLNQDTISVKLITHTQTAYNLKYSCNDANLKTEWLARALNGQHTSPIIQWSINSNLYYDTIPKSIMLQQKNYNHTISY